MAHTNRAGGRCAKLGLVGWLIALAVAGALFLVALSLIKVEVRVQVRRREKPTHVTVSVRALWLRFQHQFDLEAAVKQRVHGILDRLLVKVRGEHAEKVGIGDAGEPSGTEPETKHLGDDGPPLDGEVIEPLKQAARDPGHTAVDKSRFALWFDLITQARRAAKPPTRYFRTHVHLKRLKVHMELGAGDAMETALLCGGAWSVIGSGVSLAGGLVRVTPGAPDLRVQPNFQQACLRLDSECIVQFRLAHAMIAGVWFGRRFLREKGLMAWMRDRRFRKGVVHDVRASDSGADEDGHGDAEDDGGRQHRRR